MNVDRRQKEIKKYKQRIRRNIFYNEQKELKKWQQRININKDLNVENKNRKELK